MPSILVCAESRGDAIRQVSKEVVSAARSLAGALGADVDVLVLGSPAAVASASEFGAVGADRVLVGEHDAFSGYCPDAAVEVIANYCERADCAAVLFAATSQGKDLSARCAARLDRSLAAEVTELDVEDGSIVVRRPIYSGKAYAKMRFKASPALVSLRPNVFAADGPAGRGDVEALTVDPGSARTRVVGFERGEREQLDVTEASIVVTGGRGMQGPEHWKLLEDLVDALGPGATLGASRAVVDAGWRPHGEQVGQTGKVVSPGLYFAIGISGAIQHLAGMRTANVIVAVNRDAEAPIFGVANYGLVGDVFEVLPRLTADIRAARGVSG
jgi:electron transfer flavoprotein alpha subunit